MNICLNMDPDNICKSRVFFTLLVYVNDICEHRCHSTHAIAHM